MKKHLLPESGNFYKANLHCHTILSDGQKTPEQIKEEYKATLQLTCLSRVGLMAEVALQVANMRVNITCISTHDMKDGRAIVELTVNVSGIDHLKNLISRIEKVDGVLSVER